MLFILIIEQRKRKQSTINNQSSSSEAILNHIDINEFEDITYREICSRNIKNERLYCYCNYLHYGDMVKCENDKCKREWFHFNCAGLREIPNEKWYCSQQCLDEDSLQNKRLKKPLNN